MSSFREKGAEWGITLPSLAWLAVFFVVPTIIVFGIAGMILGVPVVALISSLIKEFVARRNGETPPEIKLPERRLFWKKRPSPPQPKDEKQA